MNDDKKRKIGNHPFLEMMGRYYGAYSAASQMIDRLLNAFGRTSTKSYIAAPSIGRVGYGEEVREAVAAANKNGTKVLTYTAFLLSDLGGREWGTKMDKRFCYIDTQTRAWMEARPRVSLRGSPGNPSYETIMSGGVVISVENNRDELQVTMEVGKANGKRQFIITEAALKLMTQVLEKDLNDAGEYDEFVELRGQYLEHLRQAPQKGKEGPVAPAGESAGKPSAKVEDASAQSLKHPWYQLGEFLAGLRAKRTIVGGRMKLRSETSRAERMMGNPADFADAIQRQFGLNTLSETQIGKIEEGIIPATEHEISILKQFYKLDEQTAKHLLALGEAARKAQPLQKKVAGLIQGLFPTIKSMNEREKTLVEKISWSLTAIHRYVGGSVNPLIMDFAERIIKEFGLDAAAAKEWRDAAAADFMDKYGMTHAEHQRQQAEKKAARK